MTLPDTLDALGKIAGGSLAIAGFLLALKRWLIPAYQHVKLSFEQMAFIAAELRPNGGSSFRDAIDRLERNINRMDARQWAVVTTLHDPIWESDAEGLWLRCNPAMLDLVNRGTEDMAGNGWENVVHKDDRKRVWEEFRDATERQRTLDTHFRIVPKRGSAYQVHAICVPYGAPGAAVGYVGRFSSVSRL